ncbi:MAG TPA: response regulator [Cellvibrionaceae bacterium]|nr:response regulator [Cellvibrionaceae bacterium]
MIELSRHVLIMDDEPHLLDWLEEYLESKEYEVHQVTNVQDAISKLDINIYRMVVLDLNVPASAEYLEKLKAKGDLYVEYRGLYVAEMARTKGHRGRQVVVYSVHDSDKASLVCNKIGVTYLVKGRPRQFKKELDDILSYAPQQNT